jgi:hypothetical protein
MGDRRGRAGVVLVALWIGAVPMPAAAVPQRAEAGVPREDRVAETGRFGFHSDPWLNLHHFLYQWSRSELGLGTGRAEVSVPERTGPLPSGADLNVWNEAVRFYREHVADRDHFDTAMLELKTGLVELDGDLGAAPPDVVAGLAEALVTAMPVYLSTWWSAHDRANRLFIGRVVPEVRRYEERWVDTVSRLFGGSWIDGRLRVDATAYANWQGGYTSNRPPHTVIWSRDEINLQGLYGLELVFHESGHVSALGSPLARTVADVFRAAEADEPANFRHALLFATAGELVRSISTERGLEEHVPYVVDQGLTGFAGWAPLWPPILEHWMPAVHGADRMAALRALAAELGGR